MGLAINECCDLSPWAARKMVMWAARRRYADNPERAEIRSLELAALIDTRPGKIFKLLTACGFVGAVLFCRLAAVVGDVTSGAENRFLITTNRLCGQIYDLRDFEREFRSRKRAYFDRLLAELDNEPVSADQAGDELARQQVRELEIVEREAYSRFRRYVFDEQGRLARDPSRAGKRFVVHLPLAAWSQRRLPPVRRFFDLIAFERISLTAQCLCWRPAKGPRPGRDFEFASTCWIWCQHG